MVPVRLLANRAVAFGARLGRSFQQATKQCIAFSLHFLFDSVVRWSRFHISLGYNRIDLRENAQAKLDDATILLQSRRYSNAYYLAGYSVEIGLKACIAVQIIAETIPDKAFMSGVFQHNFQQLVSRAGLTPQLSEQQDKDPSFAANWAITTEWKPDVRYEAVDITSAQLMINAIAHPKSGVLQWIKTHW